MQKTAFLICSVRNATEEETKAAEAYVKHLEANGYKIHWPTRDTEQNDPVGYRICCDNRAAIAQSDEIHVVWNPNSQGSLFDIGMAFMLQLFEPEKKIVLANPQGVPKTPQKSFNNVLHVLNGTSLAKKESGKND